MSRPDIIDPLVVRKQHLLLVFMPRLQDAHRRSPRPTTPSGIPRYAFLALSILPSVLGIWTLIRFLRVIDEFEALYLRGALKFAFVGTLSLLAAEAFLESVGLAHMPAYRNAVCAVIFWTVGLITTAWQPHWRWGYEE